VETYRQYGIKLFLVGGLTGGMTSTPGLAALDSMTNKAHLAYATVYPVALVLIILCVQSISYLA